MYRCGCSTRALKIFIKDFAGCSVERSREQAFKGYRRGFGTRPAQRQDATIESGEGIDGAALNFKDIISEARVIDANTPSNASPPSKSTIDTITLPRAQPTHSVRASFTDQALILGSPVLPVDPERVVPKQKSGSVRAASRRARKDRRVWAGTYRPGFQHNEAVARLAAEEDYVHHESIGEVKDVISEERMEQSPDLPKLDKKSEDLSLEELSETVVQDQKAGNGKTKAARRGEKIAERSRQSEAEKEAERKKQASEPERQRKKKMESWAVHKEALEKKFGEKGWAPNKRLSPDSLEGIRALHASDPQTYTTAVLSEHFQVSPENIRRILKSKWRPKPEEIEKRMERWEKRGVKKWEEMSEKGMKPPKKWRAMGVPNPKLENKKKWEDPNWEQRPKKKATTNRDKGRWRDRAKKEDTSSDSISLAGRII